MRGGVVARRRQVEVASVGEEHDDVVDWYRARLAEPAVFPWAATRWDAVRLGPAWDTTVDGFWRLPDATLGWDVLGFTGCWLQLRRGVPWRYTLEQARLLLWWYAVDEAGRWLYRDGVIQRLKGWGKDPFLATLCATELIGPCRFAGWAGDTPIASDAEDAWIPVAATALAQTKTTFRLFPSLFTPEAQHEFGVVVGKEMVYAYGDSRMIQAVTSSPNVLEGIRASFTVKNETQHWTESNGGFDMAAVIERNATKAAGGVARTLAATNAPDPAIESVGRADRDAFELAESGGSLTTGILYDSLEAPPDAPLAPEQEPGEPDDVWAERVRAHLDELLDTVRGDSVWLDKPAISRSVLDTRNPASRSRRFWLNQMHATEDAWVDPQAFARLALGRLPAQWRPLEPGDELVVFFDGSKSDDATGIVGARVSDGLIVTLGLWARPPKQRAGTWTVSREAVDLRMIEIVDTYTVLALWGDPSHTLDDETRERFWDGTLDEWHRRWKDQLRLWAKPGPGGHAVIWDMAAPAHQAEFTAHAERVQSRIEDLDTVDLVHDGDQRLVNHVTNAKRAPNRYGVSLRKASRESSRKIDLAVCMVGADMVRRALLNAQKPEKKRSGYVV